MFLNRQSIIIPEGAPFVLGSLVVTIFLFFLGSSILSAFFLVLTFFVAWFFRNPERVTPDRQGAIIAPADGKIIKIEHLTIDDLIQGNFIKISIFMNIFNVHVNRIPYSGMVHRVRYRNGKFFSANLDKASPLNEQNAIVIRTDDGRSILAVQIAGLVARRIVCWLKEGMQVKKGERFGLIRFGSRLDVYVPADTTITVTVGEKTKAGETILGEFH